MVESAVAPIPTLAEAGGLYAVVAAQVGIIVFLVWLLARSVPAKVHQQTMELMGEAFENISQGVSILVDRGQRP